jgi:hypothetical protein
MTQETVDPFMRVTVGSSVITADGHKIGSVKEKMSRHFKVETGLLQRDFWLPAETVDSAVAGEPVLLSAAKDDLDSHKVRESDIAA